MIAHKLYCEAVSVCSNSCTRTCKHAHAHSVEQLETDIADAFRSVTYAL